VDDVEHDVEMHDTGAVRESSGADRAELVKQPHPEALRRWIREGVLPARRATRAPRAAWLIRWVDLTVLADRQRRPGAGRRPRG